MIKIAMAMGLFGAVSAGALSANQPNYRVSLRGEIMRIEGAGTPPSGVTVGDSFSLSFVVRSLTPDADPEPQVGSYLDAAGLLSGRVGSRSYRSFSPGPIEIIDNSARGDVYRVELTRPFQPASIRVELIDAESAAFASDALPIELSFSDFNGKSDVATVTFEVGAAGASWIAVCDVEEVETGRFFCACDWNQDDAANSQDFFDYLHDFFAHNADFNHDGITNTQDLFDFLTCFFDVAGYCG